MADGNRLAGEKSPYLLRHAGNPVDWYPWGDEAFVHAAEQDKPIFLSIGYSSCHWCHVMERDCFNDEEVAGLLNDACVSIKVDREERPDLDALFMEVCQAQNGSGGWPLSLFLTPQGEPFFAATFLPKRTAGKMPGMADVTPRVKWLWLMQRDDVLRGAKQLAKSIESGSSFSRGGHINSFHIKAAAKELKSIFDVRHGGFGPAPKFPCAPRLLFLLEYAKDAKNARLTPTEKEELTRMVSLTLRKMWSGGIHDHIGGGYARYATDDRWVTPHFEKMLYDQAMLLWTAAAAYETEQDVFYQKFAEDVAGCILRDFTSPEACFWSSIDADSEGDEGKFYRWTEEEIRTLLPQGDAGIFCAAYAILPGGNFVHEMTGRQMGNNVLYEASTVPDLARRYGLRPADLAKRLENDRRVLFEARNKRVKPEIDDKILMDWNGFTIGALAYAGRVFEKKEWVLSGERAALFLQKVLVDPKGAWRRRYRAKEAAIPALPGDYAALMWGVMELYESSSADKQKKDWLKYAESLAVQLEENFGDGQTGGFFLSPASEEHIFLRRKSAVDDATPSANAMAMMAYAALERAAPQAKEAGKAERYAEKAGAIGSCFSRPANANPVEHISIFTACMKLKNVKEEHPAVEVEDNKIEDKRIEDARTENKKAEDTRIEDRRGGSARHGRDTRSDLKRRR